MTKRDESRASTGIAGFDEVLRGGFIPQRAYLLRGGPGTGKTTAGLSFLRTGAKRNESVLFITMGEREADIRRNAASLHFELDGVSFLDLSPPAELFTTAEAYDIFAPSEVERGPIAQRIIDAVEKLGPRRVFLDSMTQLRYLCPDAYQFHRQALAFVRYLVEHGATVVFTSEGSERVPDDDLQFLADGVISLSQTGSERHLTVTKFRGSGFSPGRHSLRLSPKGATVFPRLAPEEHATHYTTQKVPSGIPELDEMLCGGLETGTIALLSGPTGVGKTTVGVQFMKEAAARGRRSAVFLFDEARETMEARCEAVGIPVKDMQERGNLVIETIEPMRYSPDEFALLVRREVEQRQADVIMIDSVAGYRLSVDSDELVSQLHGLGRYLKNRGVTGLLINETDTIIDDPKVTSIGISYLADTVLLLRYYREEGVLKKSIGVLKKRLSDFQKRRRELRISAYGLRVGEPLGSGPSSSES